MQLEPTVGNLRDSSGGNLQFQHDAAGAHRRKPTRLLWRKPPGAANLQHSGTSAGGGGKVVACSTGGRSRPEIN